MTEPDDRRTRLISDAIDGDAAARERLEHEGLADEAARLEAMEERLSALYAPEVIAAAGESSRDQTAGRIGGVSRRAALITLAALGAGGGAWLLTRPTAPPVDASAAHRNFVINAVPHVVCDTPEKFREYTEERLGVPLLAEFDANVVFVGWRTIMSSYDRSKRGDPRVLMAYDASGREVVVIFQERGRVKPRLNPGSPLNLHERRFGGVTAWEASPSDAPVVLPLLSEG